MKITSVIKNEFKVLKERTAAGFIIAALAAAAVTALAVITAPLEPGRLPAAGWIPLLLEPLVTSFLFFALVPKPGTSVFRAVKLLCCIGVPVGLAFLTNVFLDPNRAEFYSENFVNRFLPVWAAVWWLGTALAYVLMRLIAHLTAKGIAKGSFPARAAYALAVMYTPQRMTGRSRRPGKGKWAVSAVCVLMVTAGVFLGTVAVYLYIVYTNMEFEAILFTMRFAAGGLAIEDIIAGTAIVLIFLSLAGYFSYHIVKCFRNSSLTAADGIGHYTLVMNGRKRAVNIALSVLLLIVGAAMAAGQTNFFHYAKMKLGRSDIYEKHYVVPDGSVLTFPEKKRNLIFLYLESMENSYASKEAGGAMDRNYIPGLTELTKQSGSVSFSNTELLGGPSVFVPSITFTQGSTVAQTSGISLNTQLFPENGRVEYPSMIRLEDILHDNGYDQLYIEGSNGEFSMYDQYVGRYDSCTLFDRITAAEQGYTDENADYIWKWGIEDRKLIDITKQLITDMSRRDKPFFVTMYTMDTHSFESGHRCPECDSSISQDYLAAVNCCSRQITEFVSWIKQQPFYENTTVILIGDHLGNEHTTKVDPGSDHIRTTYNCIINPAKTPHRTVNRLYSSLDMFPTTLSAIGAEIRGDRLGLGTDLFSGTPTLCEELGEEEYKLQLEQTSDYYRREFCGVG